MNAPALLVLEDGTVFSGQAYGARGVTYAELVFTTAMTGYLETLTNPAYLGHTVVMTSPHIGNTGVIGSGEATPQVRAAGIVVRDPALRASSWRSDGELEELLQAQDIVGIRGIDTRALTRHLRQHGPMKSAIFSGEELPAIPGEYGYQELIEKVKQAPAALGSDALQHMGTPQSYMVPAAGETKARVAAVDLGIDPATIASFTTRGVQVHVVPPTATFEDINNLSADGVFFSSGPGDPATATQQIQLARQILSAKIPFFGIGLGHQIMGLALGFHTYRLTAGHHGSNQPVQDALTGRVTITVHSHGFAVEMPLGDPVPTPYQHGEFGRAQVSHLALNDSTVEGIRCLDIPAFGVQFHPEPAAGPRDAGAVFDQFIQLMKLSTSTQEHS